MSDPAATDPVLTAPVLLPFAPPAPRAVRAPGETLLGVLPGATADRRTAVTRRTGLCGAVSVRLSDQSFSSAVGWFTQGSVELAADQLTGLKALLAAVPAAPPVVRPTPRLAPQVSGSPATLPFAAAG